MEIRVIQESLGVNGRARRGERVVALRSGSLDVRCAIGCSRWPGMRSEGVLQGQMHQEKSRNGAGLRILTGRVTSPTLRRQFNDLLQALPEAKWYRYEPINDDAATAGAALAFGRPLTALPRLGDAQVVLALDADPLGPGPQQIRMARAFNNARRAGASDQEFLRLYAAEPAWSLTGCQRRIIAWPCLRNWCATLLSWSPRSLAPIWTAGICPTRRGVSRRPSRKI